MITIFKHLRRIALAALPCLIMAITPAHAGPDDKYVVIGGAVAEIFATLDPDGEVVGIGAGFPQTGPFADAPVVRGFRLTSAENLLSLRPTKILIAGRQTTPGLIQQLDGTGVDVEVFETTMTLEDVQTRITRLGDILDRQQKAKVLSNQTTEAWTQAIVDYADETDRPNGLFVLSGGGRGNLAAGQDTLVAQLIQWAGGDNLATMIEGYKPLSQEAMAAMKPAFILTNMEGLNLVDGEAPLLSAPGIKLTPAYKNDALIAVPNGLLTEAGIRTPEAIHFLAKKMAALRNSK